MHDSRVISLDLYKLLVSIGPGDQRGENFFQAAQKDNANE